MTTYRMPVTPEQARWWLDKSGMTVSVSEVDLWMLRVLDGTLPPTPPIVISDGAVVNSNDANRLAAIAGVISIKGFPTIEMDVEFTTALPDAEDAYVDDSR